MRVKNPARSVRSRPRTTSGRRYSPAPHLVRTLADGITYQRPEVALAFKAVFDRAKDLADLEAALPLLDRSAIRWLADTVGRLYAGHRWLDRLG